MSELDSLHPDLRSLYEQVQKKLAVLRDVQTKKTQQIDARSKLEAQRNENRLVQGELDRLEPDAGVYKLIGPALVSQDPADAIVIVGKRLEFIETELKNCDQAIKNLDSEEEKEKRNIGEIQERMQRRAAELQQQQAGQQQQKQ